MAQVVVIADDERRVEVLLEPMEVGLLGSICAQIADFVTPDADVDPLVALVGLDPQAVPPEDPALKRLLPDAYTEDDEAAARFRRFTERDLRERKRLAAVMVGQALAPLGAAGGMVTFTGAQVDQWLGFLNDARLTIGARLDIREDNHRELADLPDDDPRGGMYAVYDWLTYVQDATVTGLLEP